MQRLANNVQPPLVPNLRAVHEQMLRERSDTIWEEATHDSALDLGKMIQAIRLRLDDNEEAFGARLGAIAHPDKLVAYWRATVRAWERNKYIPRSSKDEPDTLCEAMALAATIADRAPNGLARALSVRKQTSGNKETLVLNPWFTPAKQEIFRQAFHQCAMETNADKAKYKVSLPSLEVAPPPDMRSIAPTLKVTDASSLERLVRDRHHQTRGGNPQASK